LTVKIIYALDLFNDLNAFDQVEDVACGLSPEQKLKDTRTAAENCSADQWCCTFLQGKSVDEYKVTRTAANYRDAFYMFDYPLFLRLFFFSKEQVSTRAYLPG